MALFKRDYNKPGPGVPKNAPRKRGFARFFEVLVRDFGNLIKLNLLFQLCLLPSEILLGLAVFSLSLGYSPLLFVLGALVASIPVGPAYTAVLRAISKMLRDEPGFIWHDFKKDFKDNFRKMLLPGILYTAIIGAQLLALTMWGLLEGETSFVSILFFVLSLLIFWMTARYFFLQAGYLELGGRALLKNSLLLALGNAPRSLAAAAITLAFSVLQLLVTIISFPFTLVIGYTIPCLCSLMFVWPPVNKTFKIEETLKERAQKQVLEDAGE